MPKLSTNTWANHFPSGADKDFSLPRPGTLVGAWATRLAIDGHKPLLHSNGQWIQRGTFWKATEVVAGRLHRAGLVRGDRVLVSGVASVRLAVAHVACLRLGLVVVPVNSACQEPELAYLIGDARPRAALVDQPDWFRMLSTIDSELLIATTGVDLEDGPLPDLDRVSPEDQALIAYTSGTTGQPKGAVHTQASLLAGAASVTLAWRWTDVDRLLLCLPLFHMHGLGLGLHGTLLEGASAVLQDRFDPERVLSALVEEDCTMFFGVPTMYHRLLGHPNVGNLEGLRLCVSGSAPLAADLHGRLAALGGTEVLERYGTTETLMLASNPFVGERRPGSVGTPLPGVELKLDEADGEVLAKGPSMFSGYWGRPEADLEAFTDGWFRTGDLAQVGPDGYLTISGRSKELIITGGLNVYPREVEEVLVGHGSIAEVAVIGKASVEWGEEVVAWVVPIVGASCPSVEELREFASETLASYKLPRRVIETTILPRNALGKVLRHEMRDPVADG